MADPQVPQMRATQGASGYAKAARLLMATGACVWPAFPIAAATGAPAEDMWMGMLIAAALSAAATVAYSAISRDDSGVRREFYFAGQQWLSSRCASRHARIGKFILGWGAHLHYRVYPALLAAAGGTLLGYLTGYFFPGFMSASNPGPAFMAAGALVFALLAAWISRRKARISVGLSVGICLIEALALISFAVVTLAYRIHHPAGTVGLQFDRQTLKTYGYEFARHGDDGSIVRNSHGLPQPLLDAAGKPVAFSIAYPGKDARGRFLAHRSAGLVAAPHRLSWVMMQVAAAMFIFGGFESAACIGKGAGGEPGTVSGSWVWPIWAGLICCLIELFAAGYFLNSGYSMQSALGSAAPLEDITIIAGDAMLGRGHGRYLMLGEALAALIALLGAASGSLRAGVRVACAMGHDNHPPELIGISQAVTEGRAAWNMAYFAAAAGALAVALAFADSAAPEDGAIAALPHGVFSSAGFSTHEQLAGMPNSLLTVTLTASFGTFVLYAFGFLLLLASGREKAGGGLMRRAVVPGFGLLGSLACLGFYLMGPAMGTGAFKELLLALGISAAWGVYGGICFLRSSKKKKSRSMAVETRRSDSIAS